jgi:O-antigen/teichoic acid export membrane protein
MGRLGMLAGIGALQAVSLVAFAARGKLSAMALGPEGVGILGVLEPLVQGLAHVFGFGLPIVAVKFLSRAHAEGPAAFGAAYAQLFRRVAIATLAGTCGALLLAWGWPSLLGPALWPHRALLLLALVGTPLLAMRDVIANALAAARATKASAALGPLVALGSTVGAGVGLLVIGGTAGFLGGTLLGTAVVLGAAARRLPTLAGRHASERAASQDTTSRSAVAEAALVLWACFFAYPIAQFAVRHLVLRELGSADAGLLQVGLGLSGVVALLLGPATALYLAPVLNRGGLPAAQGLVAITFLRELALAVSVLSLPLVLFPHEALLWLFAPAFSGVAGLLALFVAGQAARVLSGVFYVLLVGLDDVKAHGVLVVLAQTIFVGLSWKLCARDGLHGVALAFFASEAALLVLAALRVAWRHGIRPSGGVAAFVTVAVVLPLAIGSGSLLVPSHDAIGLAIRAVCGALVALALWSWSRRAPVAIEQT